MFKQAMIGLFAMSVVAMVWTEANAGCAAIGGSLFCAPWLTGSEINNPSISCEDPKRGCIKDQVTVRASVGVSDDGGIPGFVVCKPLDRDTKESLTTSRTTPTDADDDEDTDECEGCISRRFTLTSANTPLPLTAQAKINCKSGFCQTSIELDPKKCFNCCRTNEKFVTFTATEFHGVVNFFNKKGTLIASFDQKCTLPHFLLTYVAWPPANPKVKVISPLLLVCRLVL